MNPAEKQAWDIILHKETCAHEAGHAAAAMLLGLDVREVFVNPVDIANPRDDDVAGATAVARPDPGDIEGLCKCVIMTMAGRLAEGRPVPQWPLRAPETPDEQDIARDCEALGVDANGYEALVNGAKDLVASRQFGLVHMGVQELLEQGHRPDAYLLKQVKSIARHKMSGQPGHVAYATFPAQIRTKSLGSSGYGEWVRRCTSP